LNIARAKAEDAAALMAFIDTHWRKGHVLATHKPLLDWQHYCPETDDYNFLLARNSSGRIEGVLGFIPTTRYDDALAPNAVAWLSLWKVVDDAQSPIVGLLLLRALEAQGDWQAVGTLGVTEVAEKIYRMLGWRTDTLSHYYLCNPDLSHFAIAVEPQAAARLPVQRPLTEKSPADDWMPPRPLAVKSGAYLRRRFGEHPFYKYRLFMVDEDLCVVVRMVEANGARVLRIVDLVGDISLVPEIAGALQDLVVREGCEYIDLTVAGEDQAALLTAGWQKRDGATVLPGYFEPFEARNVDIGYALKGNAPFLLLRGDADQERPNRISVC